MTQVTSFNPVADHSATLLILGSMPGRVSLDAQEYYAHSRNSFWRIMAEIIGFPLSSPYPVRLETLKQSGVALWDVLHSCVRPGSADSAIESGTRVANDFKTFFSSHPMITLVCFNGGEAEKSYNRFVLPKLNPHRMKAVRLPSTSPAYAALTYKKKLDAWRSTIALHLAESA
jgi:double-stranded uracil-DNA glycosylase